MFIPYLHMSMPLQLFSVLWFAAELCYNFWSSRTIIYDNSSSLHMFTSTSSSHSPLVSFPGLPWCTYLLHIVCSVWTRPMQIRLAEARWTAEDEKPTEETSERQNIWQSGEQDKHFAAILLETLLLFWWRSSHNGKEIADSVVNCKPINSRMISIRTAAKHKNITIMQMYAPYHPLTLTRVLKHSIRLEENTTKGS